MTAPRPEAAPMTMEIVDPFDATKLIDGDLKACPALDWAWGSLEGESKYVSAGELHRICWRLASLRAVLDEYRTAANQSAERIDALRARAEADTRDRMQGLRYAFEDGAVLGFSEQSMAKIQHMAEERYPFPPRAAMRPATERTPGAP